MSIRRTYSGLNIDEKQGGIIGNISSKEKSNRINTSTYCKSDGKEKTNMSFVGIKVCKDGLVAFGDSKSSKYDTFNNLCLDKGNETVQKVFKTENFLLVTFGTNIIPGRKEMKIED